MARGGKRPNSGRKAAKQRNQTIPAELRPHCFKPGESGNPKGRPAAGLAVRDWINILAGQDVTEEKLRRITKDPKAPWSKRTAALRMLRSLETGDIADFAGFLRGENNLEDLRAMGISTEVIKKFKQKTRVVPKGDGEVEEVIDREIELHDRSGDDFDRILDRTIGRPVQEVHQHVDGTLRTSADGEAAIDQLLAGVRDRLGAHSG
jgi:hypothetical protein